MKSYKKLFFFWHFIKKKKIGKEMVNIESLIFLATKMAKYDTNLINLIKALYFTQAIKMTPFSILASFCLI